MVAPALGFEPGYENYEEEEEDMNMICCIYDNDLRARYGVWKSHTISTTA